MSRSLGQSYIHEATDVARPVSQFHSEVKQLPALEPKSPLPRSFALVPLKRQIFYQRFHDILSSSFAVILA